MDTSWLKNNNRNGILYNFKKLALAQVIFLVEMLHIKVLELGTYSKILTVKFKVCKMKSFIWKQ